MSSSACFDDDASIRPLERWRLACTFWRRFTMDSLEVLRNAAIWFEPDRQGFGPLLDRIADAEFVLIGEASHGTHEFYNTRAELTKALILEKGFNAVAVEADWPDAYRVNRRVRHASNDRDAMEALDSFTRFPRWMSRN